MTFLTWICETSSVRNKRQKYESVCIYWMAFKMFFARCTRYQMNTKAKKEAYDVCRLTIYPRVEIDLSSFSQALRGRDISSIPQSNQNLSSAPTTCYFYLLISGQATIREAGQGTETTTCYYTAIRCLYGVKTCRARGCFFICKGRERN